MYESLGNPSVKDYKWVIQSNQIKDFPVTVQDVDVAHNIWRKIVPALKVNTTRKKHIPVTDDLVQLPEYLVKLHKDIYFTVDMLFVNGIPFIIILSRKILSTAVNHLSNRKLETIFKAFKDIYRYYMKCGFHITTSHSDGEFAPLQAMLYEHIPGGPSINITSATEHFPGIKH